MHSERLVYMTLKNYLSIDGRQLERFSSLNDRYKRLHADPVHCAPMIMIETPVRNIQNLSWTRGNAKEEKGKWKK